MTKMLDYSTGKWETLPPLTERQKKSNGMKQAATKHAVKLAQLRELADILATRFPRVNIEDVRKLAQIRGIEIDPKDSKAYMGSVFKGWQWDGTYTECKHLGSHGRPVKNWKKKSDEKLIF